MKSSLDPDPAASERQPVALCAQGLGPDMQVGDQRAGLSLW